MERVYNKLVRDNIPNIIIGKGENPVTRVLNDKEYKDELEKKLYEEYQEVINANTKDEKIEELADMVEVISYLSKIEGSNLEEVINVAKEKSFERGGFEEKIFLEKVIEPN